jgi:CheY-like chemotaxis protein
MAKVMLVEDDNNLREIYQLRLQAEGYDIVTAKDGEEALVVAKAEKPELIISDVMMPKISGFEMLDILRNTDGLKDVKIIMLTALGQTDDQARADKLGADRYLVKSQVTLEDIAKTAHELLEDEAKAADAVLPAAATDVVAAPVQAAPVVAAPVATPPAPDPVPTPAEPAAQAAAPAPVATPEPTSPSPDPATSPVAAAAAPVDTASATSGAQTTAQEEANVEANIENFIAGATTEATPPQSSPENSDTPEAAPEPAVEPAPPVVEAPIAPPVVAPEPVVAAPVENPAPAASNDQLMTDAVNTINASANQEAAPIAVPPPPSEAVVPVTAQPATPAPAPAAPPAEPAASPSSSEQVAIANKKVITPIESSPKKDINTLLALEQAKAAANQPPPPPVAVIATNESGPEQQPLIAQVQSGVPPVQANPEGENTPTDPNSIAL